MASERTTLVPGAAAVGGTSVSGEIEGSGDAIRARGYWEQAWIRFRRDRVAMASGIVIILIVLVAFIGAPLAAHILGHGPNDINSNAVINYAPAGPWTTVKNLDSSGSSLYVLGASDAVAPEADPRLLPVAAGADRVAGALDLSGD